MLLFSAMGHANQIWAISTSNFCSSDICSTLFLGLGQCVDYAVYVLGFFSGLVERGRCSGLLESSPELAARIEQAAHNQMHEHLDFDGVVIKRAVNQLRATNPHLGASQCGHEIRNDVVLLLRKGCFDPRRSSTHCRPLRSNERSSDSSREVQNDLTTL